MIDFSIDTTDVIVERDVNHILQQIDILFNTSPCEIIGEPHYGSDFEKFLYNLQVSNYDIENYIKSTIINNVNLFDFQLDVKVYITKGTINDIIFVDITIYDDINEYSKKYKIT